MSIEDIVGAEKYALLADAHGGTNYNIPSTIDSKRGENLAKIIGDEAAAKMISYAGGTSEYIRVGVEKRHDAVIDMHNSGMSINAISRKFRYEGRYSESQIKTILACNSHIKNQQGKK